LKDFTLLNMFTTYSGLSIEPMFKWRWYRMRIGN